MRVLGTKLLISTLQKIRNMNTEEIKQFIAGDEWHSIAPELRPSSIKNPDGSIKPFYLRRTFSYLPDDVFELIILNYADPLGKVPLAKLFVKGHIEWKGEHPIAENAQKVDFIADKEYTVTPLHTGFVDLLNAVTKGFNPWIANEAQSIFKKEFPPFGLVDGQVFMEYDLIYVFGGLMFWGARHVDGRGFDSEENRPTNLQIPLIRNGNH